LFFNVIVLLVEGKILKKLFIADLLAGVKVLCRVDTIFLCSEIQNIYESKDSIFIALK
jgi:hypothetical protein